MRGLIELIGLIKGGGVADGECCDGAKRVGVLMVAFLLPTLAIRKQS